jgi:NOL1/NOP2/fmu family ribosome biogenesis protein
MFRKDENARSEWSSANAKMCVTRQRDILENAIDCLKEDGYLIYSTCTFNPEENEHNIQWLIDEMEMEYCYLPVDSSWNLHTPKNNLGYSCLPSQVKSEGFYIALLRKRGKMNTYTKYKKLKSIEKDVVIPEAISSLFSDDIKVNFHQGFYYAFPKEQIDLGKFLLKELNIMKWGVRVGEMINNKLIPDHELALSFLLSENSFPKVNLEKQEALNYLKGNSISVNAPIGWCIITYENVPLGWIKNLGNRTNNYYPKEYRIRMDISKA